uniref:Elongin-C n=1 Tax=Neovison vison TaxID=452646 RepID=A0A8C7A5U5_NEOVI
MDNLQLKEVEFLKNIMGGKEKTYHGYEDYEAMYVISIPSDGREFSVKRQHALTSGTIKAMLNGPCQFAGNEVTEFSFRDIPSHALWKVCMYFTHEGHETNSSMEIPEFPTAPEISQELRDGCQLLRLLNKVNYNKLLSFFSI